MAQQTINIGNVANDGTGDGLRTAFDKCNDNFTELYASVVDPTADRIANGTSNARIATTGGNLAVTINGTANVAVFSTSSASFTTPITTTGNITGNNLSITAVTSNLNPLVNGGSELGTTGSRYGNGFFTGNVTVGGFFIGDGGLLSNVTVVSNVAVTQIANGTTSLAVASSGGNIVGQVAGGTVITLATGGANLTGYANITGAVSTASTITATGNITGGNIVTGALMNSDSILSATANITGNVDGGNYNTTGKVVATGNLETGGQVVAAGNVSGLNINAGGVANITGNVSGLNLLTSGFVNATGNITGGNLITAGLASITGNLTSGNVSTTNLSVSGTFSPASLAVTGNLSAGNISTTGVATVTGNLSAGNLSGTNIVGTLTTASQTNITSVGTLGSLSVTANVGAGNVNASGIVSATANISGGNLLTAGILSVNSSSGAIAIKNGGSNGVGNIGDSGGYFNTVFAKATSAQYADVAEYYTSDQDYEVGTVVDFGGTHEVTINSVESSTKVAGVISSNPAIIMNSGLAMSEEVSVIVALTGRVPTKVTGSITKGDMMVADGKGGAKASAAPILGSVIGKALENFDGESGVIEIVVGRL